MTDVTQKFVGVMSSGDPRSPELWSATPFNIIQALEERDWKVMAVDGSKLLSEQQPLEGAADKNKLQLMLRGVRNQFKIRQLGQAAAARIRVLPPEYKKIIHLHAFSYLPVVGATPGRKHYLIIDSTSHTWSRYTAFQSARASHLVADYLAKRIYQQMEHIFAIGEYVRDDLIQHYGMSPDKVTAIGTGLGVIKPYFGNKNYYNGMILTVAKERFNEKGTDLLVASFRLAQKKSPLLRLKIVGESFLQLETEGLTNAEITGFLSEEALQQCFEEAALFAMPARNEPWGLVYLEALSCKTPILGLKRNAIPELTADGRYGFMVAEPTPENVGKTLLDACSDREKLVSMGEEGQARCLNHYTWDKVALRIEEVLLN